MTGAANFLWIIIALLLIAWALAVTGTINLGVNFSLWINVLLVLALVGAVLNLVVFPFLSRTRKSSTVVSDTGTAADTAGGAATTGTARREAVQETKEGQSLS